jgi:hypothetical protein
MVSLSDENKTATHMQAEQPSAQRGGLAVSYDTIEVEHLNRHSGRNALQRSGSYRGVWMRPVDARRYLGTGFGGGYAIEGELPAS